MAIAVEPIEQTEMSSATVSREAVVARAILALAFAVPVALLIAFHRFVPIWDGRVYADCIVDAATHFTLKALSCASHPSHAYTVLQVLAQAPWPGSTAALLAVDCALGALTLVAFHRALTRAFPGDDRRLERALATLALAVQPLILAAELQPNLDLPLLAFFVCCVAMALEGRLVAMTLFGALLVFSKETGVLLYAGLLASYALVFITRAPATVRAKIATLRALAFTVLPLFIFVLYFVGARAAGVSGAWTGTAEGGSAIDQLLTIRLADPIFRSYLALIFVIGFLWVPSVVIAVDAGVGAARALFAQPARAVRGTDPRVLTFLALLTVVSVLALTRIRTFANPRYFLPLYPLLLMSCVAALFRVVPTRAMRLAILSIVAALFAWSAVRTADPVSRAVYGTFSLGGRRMLDMTSITSECCGYGRDQLVYNLEFTAVADAEDASLALIHPTDATVIGLDLFADWNVGGPLDARTSRRTLARDDVVRPHFRHAIRLSYWRPPPETVYFLAFPNVDNALALARLARRYRVTETRTVERGGVAMQVMTMRLRAVP